ncbi:hypothetical protein THSYN_23125 [Candidatus Thiodictyon syntrophicum]|jgi:hypothetical protein|uniref:Uncharacterized protein n=1 Tax=Candidatus Thiodictyon syntrophicum TaxID=1166950 RepID=A0A2K8UDP0_9GAMM|nr:hypothetical protein THSYN_23125 [Candidatus Thiodictyon syntrophicum]
MTAPTAWVMAAARVVRVPAPVSEPKTGTTFSKLSPSPVASTGNAPVRAAMASVRPRSLMVTPYDAERADHRGLGAQRSASGS